VSTKNRINVRNKELRNKIISGIDSIPPELITYGLKELITILNVFLKERL
jgi:hypothetical protein